MTIKTKTFSPQLQDVITGEYNTRGVQTLPDYEVQVEEIKSSKTSAIDGHIFRLGIVLKALVPNTLGTQTNRSLKLIHKATSVELLIKKSIQSGLSYVSDGEIYVDIHYNSGLCLIADKVNSSTNIMLGDIIVVKNQENFGSPLGHKALNLIKSDLDFLNNIKLNISDKASSNEITAGTENTKYLTSLGLENSKYSKTIIQVNDSVTTDYNLLEYKTYSLNKSTSNTRNLVLSDGTSIKSFILIYFSNFKNGERWTMLKSDGSTVFKIYDQLTYASSMIMLRWDGTDWVEAILQKSRFSKDGSDIINHTITENKLSSGLIAKINSDNDVNIGSNGIATSKTDLPTVTAGKHFGTVNVTGNIPASTSITVGSNTYTHQKQKPDGTFANGLLNIGVYDVDIDSTGNILLFTDRLLVKKNSVGTQQLVARSVTESKVDSNLLANIRNNPTIYRKDGDNDEVLHIKKGNKDIANFPYGRYNMEVEVDAVVPFADITINGLPVYIWESISQGYNDRRVLPAGSYWVWAERGKFYLELASKKPAPRNTTVLDGSITIAKLHQTVKNVIMTTPYELYAKDSAKLYELSVKTALGDVTPLVDGRYSVFTNIDLSRNTDNDVTLNGNNVFIYKNNEFKERRTLTGSKFELILYNGSVYIYTLQESINSQKYSFTESEKKVFSKSLVPIMTLDSGALKLKHGDLDIPTNLGDNYTIEIPASIPNQTSELTLNGKNVFYYTKSAYVQVKGITVTPSTIKHVLTVDNAGINLKVAGTGTTYADLSTEMKNMVSPLASIKRNMSLKAETLGGGIFSSKGLQRGEYRGSDEICKLWKSDCENFEFSQSDSSKAPIIKFDTVKKKHYLEFNGTSYYMKANNGLGKLTGTSQTELTIFITYKLLGAGTAIYTYQHPLLVNDNGQHDNMFVLWGGNQGRYGGDKNGYWDLDLSSMPDWKHPFKLNQYSTLAVSWGLTDGSIIYNGFVHKNDMLGRVSPDTTDMYLGKLGTAEGYLNGAIYSFSILPYKLQAEELVNACYGDMAIHNINTSGHDANIDNAVTYLRNSIKIV